MEIWKRNTTSDFTIKKVANSLKPLEKKGFLNLREFQVANHLFSICNCREIPIPLPNCLLKFLGRPLNKNKTKKVKSGYYRNFNNINCSYNEIQLNYRNNEAYYKNNYYEFNTSENKQQNNIKNNNDLNSGSSDLNELNFNKYKSHVLGPNTNKIIKNDNDIDDNEIIKDEKDEFNRSNNSNEENIDIKNNDNGIVDIKDIEIKNDKKNLINDNTSNCDENNENNKEELKLRKFKSSKTQFDIKNNLNNNNDNSDNNNILQVIINRMNELEKKNEDANLKISSLLSQINTLQKEQQKISKEMNELKEEFKNIKSRNKINKLNGKNKNIYESNSKPKTLNNDNRINISLNNDNLDNDKIERISTKINGQEPFENLNQTMKNNFQRVQKRLIIKRDEKNDIKKNNIINQKKINQIKKNNDINNNFMPVDTIEQNNNINLKTKKLGFKKKMPLDEKDNFTGKVKNINMNNNGF